MKIKSRDFSNKLEIINDSLINKLYSNDKKYHKNIYCNDDYFNKRLFTHENSSEINFIYKNIFIIHQIQIYYYQFIIDQRQIIIREKRIK